MDSGLIRNNFHLAGQYCSDFQIKKKIDHVLGAHLGPPNLVSLVEMFKPVLCWNSLAKQAPIGRSDIPVPVMCCEL